MNQKISFDEVKTLCFQHLVEDSKTWDDDFTSSDHSKWKEEIDGTTDLDSLSTLIEDISGYDNPDRFILNSLIK